jgi:hypothetical protein
LAVRQFVVERLSKEVADHALALRAEDVESVRPHLTVGLAGEGEQTDLRTIAVGDDEVVVARECGEDTHRLADVAALGVFFLRLATSQECVSAEGYD